MGLLLQENELHDQASLWSPKSPRIYEQSAWVGTQTLETRQRKWENSERIQRKRNEWCSTTSRPKDWPHLRILCWSCHRHAWADTARRIPWIGAHRSIDLHWQKRLNHGADVQWKPQHRSRCCALCLRKCGKVLQRNQQQSSRVQDSEVECANDALSSRWQGDCASLHETKHQERRDPPLRL